MLKWPRILVESNLNSKIKVCKIQRRECLLLPSIIVVRVFFVVEIAGVFDGDLVSLFWLVDSVSRLQYFSGNTHDDFVKVTVPGTKKSE